MKKIIVNNNYDGVEIIEKLLNMFNELASNK